MVNFNGEISIFRKPFFSWKENICYNVLRSVTDEKIIIERF